MSGLFTYPIKGCKGISLEKSPLEARGLAFDRRWQLVDHTGMFISQREISQMALIQVSIQANQMILKAPQMSDLTFEIFKDGPQLEVQVWDDVCLAEAVSFEADKWLSDFLNMECRLVYMPEYSERFVDQTYAKTGQITGFSDGFPLLLISEASLIDLNQRLESPILMDRFRPNLVVSGTEPYAEDTWKLIRIGGVIFEIAKPCARCTVTTIHQQTAEKNKEPLKTLATYRQVKNKIFFGQNLLHLENGELELGQKVEVLEKLTKPNYLI